MYNKIGILSKVVFYSILAFWLADTKYQFFDSQYRKAELSSHKKDN